MNVLEELSEKFSFCDEVICRPNVIAFVITRAAGTNANKDINIKNKNKAIDSFTSSKVNNFYVNKLFVIVVMS